MPSHHLAIEIEDLLLKQAILLDQAHHRAARHFRDPVIFASDDDLDQSSQAHPCRLLSVMPNSARCARMVLPILVRCLINIALVRCSTSTLCCSTVLTSANRMFGPCDRFADRFGIGLIILLCLHIRLHICRRHEPNLVPHRSKVRAQ